MLIRVFMKRGTRVFLSAFIVISISGLIALVVVQYNKKQKNKLKISSVGAPVVENLRYSGTKAGRLEWEFKAESALRSGSDEETLFKGVKASFYAKDGMQYNLVAREGRLKGSIVSAYGGVTIESQDGLRIASEEIIYSTEAKEITSGGRIEINTRGMDLTGKGLFMKVDEGRLELSGDVRAIWRPQAESGV